MMTKFNQDLYAASLKALIERGTPPDKAEAASIVIGKDDGSKNNFGRTPEDQQAIDTVMEYLQLEAAEKLLIGG